MARHTFFALFSSLCILSTQHIIATEAPSSGPILLEKGVSRQASQNFTQAVKKVTPAVVSIRVTLSSKKSAQQTSPYDEQMDPFMDEFWRRFFGMPQGGPQRPERKSPAMAQGSGFVVSADGKILTNNHVIEDADKINVIFSDGKECSAQVIGRDPNTDIALLQINATDLPYLVLANSDDLDIGEWVIACGNLLGFQTSITVGVVSGKGRNDLDVVPVEEFIQTDAAINRGNSGGPLLNLDGEVVGMNTAFATNTGGYLGLGFAIPSNLIKHVMKEILEHGKVIRGFLGVNLQKIDSDLAKAFNLPKAEGALVTDIVKDGPADKAGIKPGDIILRVNEKSISNVGSLRNFISLLQPNQQVALLVRRDDKEISLNATIGTFPENSAEDSAVQNKIGILVEQLTKELAQKYGYAEENGVIIKYVDPMSLAHELGIRPGQLILSVNRSPITTPEEFYNILKASTEQNQILLCIKAGQTVRFISIGLE